MTTNTSEAVDSKTLGPVRSRPRSMTDLPPWIGGLTVTMMFLATGVLITYTLLPLPGQESLGSWNYVASAAIYVASMRLPRLIRRLMKNSLS
ncbi:hypothetical protein [Parafrankia sp. FMc2]|uniref:hypothetical protein n=1 Tax=Parafrankia sp. FMc2 TaxID=3233196 RepID=UPI0034D3F8AB